MLGAAGLSLSLASGASGGPAVDIPTPNGGVNHEITLVEEEVSDVSLATFYVFDKENIGTLRPGVQLVRGGCGGGGCGCGGCGGYRGCGGCRGCVGFRGCGGCVGFVACGGCGGCLVGRLLHIVGRLPPLLDPNACRLHDRYLSQRRKRMRADTVACQSAGPSMAKYKAVSEAMQRPP